MIEKNTVHVSIPASVAGNLGDFKGAVDNILDKLGCAACCSGHDIYFDLQRDFVFNNQFTVSAVPTAFSKSALDTKYPTVSASLAPKLAHDIKSVHKSIDKIADLIGCQACCSGHDLYFSSQQRLVVDKKLNVNEIEFSVV